MKWIRPRECEAGACPEVAFGADHVLIRSSELTGRILRLTRAEWEQLRTGDFDEQEAVTQ